MLKLVLNKIVLYLYVLFIFLTIIQITGRIFYNQFDFDEGYNLQIALNLHNLGKYATFDGLLDMNITTGPTVLIPGAFLYSPSHPTNPRIIPAIFTMIFLTFVLTRFFTNRLQKLMFLAFVNATPLFFLFSSVVLGEMPGFIFLFFCYIAYSRSKFLASGMLFALSVLTKNVYIIGIIPIVMYEIHELFLKRSRISDFKKYVLFSGGMLIPFALWEWYKFMQFNFDLQRYISYAKSSMSFTFRKGTIHFERIENRLEMLRYTFHIGGAFLVFFITYINSHVYLKYKSPHLKLLSAFSLIFTLYFVCFGATNWYRHFFPAVVPFILIIPFFISSFYKYFNFDRKLFTAAVLVSLLLSTVNYLYRDSNKFFMKQLVEQNLLFLDQSNKPYVKQKKILSDQYDTAAYITKYIRKDEVISGFTWLNSPEIAYLAGRRIERDPKQPEVMYIISSIYDRFLDPDASRIVQSLDKTAVYANDSYTLYKKTGTMFTRFQN